MHTDGQKPPLQIQLSFERNIVSLIDQHPIVDGLEQIQLVFLEHLVGGPAPKPIGPQPQHTLRRGIEGGNDPLPVDGEQSRGDRIHHCFNVSAPTIQLEVGLPKRDVRFLHFRFAALQIGGHAIEGFDQGADLIRRLGFDAHGQIPLSDRLRRLGQPLNRHGNAARHIKPEPGRTEQNHDRDDRHQQIRSRFDGILHRLHLFVFGILTPDALHLAEQRFRHIGIDHHHPVDFSTADAGGDRYTGPHEPSRLCFLDGREFLLAVDHL